MAWLRLALFVSLVVCCAFATVSKEDGVDVLTVDNYDEWLASKEHALVEFYAPWCGHCKHLAPEYAAAAAALAASGSTVALGKVDVTENEALGEKYSIQGFPTLIWFENGERVNYDGGRTKDTILSWIKRQTLNELPVIKSAEDFETAKAAGPVVVHYGTSSRAGDLLSLAKKDGDINGYYVTDESLFGEYTDGDVVIFSPYAEAPVVVRAAEDLQQVIQDNIYPAYSEFSNEQFGRLAKNGWVVVAVGPFTDPEKSNLESIVSQVTGLGAGILYGDSAMLGRAVAGVGASGEVFPTAVIINPSEQKQFAFNEENEFNAETLKEFIVTAIDGTIKPYRKSEPLPENGDSGVVTLVAKNFDEYINAGKPAFVKYYAPWCGHCKTLAPVWDELAEAIPRSSAIIAKLDATANYVEEAIQGYPTLIWYNANGEKEDYNGGRDLESLVAFVKSKIPAGDDHAHSHEEL